MARLANYAGRSKPILIYILSPSYSGSTLLTLLLAQHEEIATVGELKASRIGDPSSYICSCGSSLVECDFWSNVEDECRKNDLDFSVSNFATTIASENRLIDRIVNSRIRSRIFEIIRKVAIGLIPAASAGLASMNRRNYLISQAVCKVQGSSIFLDGSKSPARFLNLMRSEYWDTKAVFLTRDGRGVAASTVKHHGMSYQSAVERWVNISTEIDRAKKIVGSENCVSLHYEDLCRRPLDEVVRVLQALEIDLGNFDLNVNRGGTLHILGNKMRLIEDLDIRLDEKWRSDLSGDNLAIFERIAGDRNRGYGYVD